MAGDNTLDIRSAAVTELDRIAVKNFAVFTVSGEMFFNREKNFAFVRMGTRHEAEKVKKALDGVEKNGRTLKVRFSPHQGAVKVTNLGKFLIAQKSSFYREVTV